MRRRGFGILDRMSRLLALASAVVFAIAVVSSGASAADGGPSPIAAKPGLMVFQLSPLTVRGYSFKARERVTVTLDGGKQGVHRVQATVRGTFSTSFKSVRLLRCQTVTIRAVGSLGSRAFRQVPRPDCRQP
jgi:hypothetical protein